jgi:DNA-binding NtrC family response regulator
MHKPQNVLIIDDDAQIHETLAAVLSPKFAVHSAFSGEDGLKEQERLQADLVLLDLMLPQMGGLAVLRALKRTSADVLVIMMSAYGQIRTAVQAIQSGAADYLEKPFDKPRLLSQIDQILAARAPKEVSLRDRIIGESRPMKRIWKLVEQIGPTDIPVLLQGETGTGKELFARALHETSKRAQAPFVAIDCGTLPEHLTESELFGYEEGAFTGALKRKPGKVSWANQGSLFLDEIGALPLACQSKLLRLVEEQSFTPLGARDSRIKRLEVRFISATNTPLRQAIDTGGFRRDLYHRLNGLTLEVPPLRDRDGDLELLVRYFLDQHRRKHAQPDLEISEECLEALKAYSWPGNVRELQQVLAAAAAIAGHRISVEHLPSHLRECQRVVVAVPAAPPAGLAGSAHVDLRRIKEWAGREAEKKVILELQKRTRVNRQELARILGVDPKTLRSRLREIQQESASAADSEATD